MAGVPHGGKLTSFRRCYDRPCLIGPFLATVRLVWQTSCFLVSTFLLVLIGHLGIRIIRKFADFVLSQSLLDSCRYQRFGKLDEENCGTFSDSYHSVVVARRLLYTKPLQSFPHPYTFVKPL